VGSQAEIGEYGKRSKKSEGVVVMELIKAVKKNEALVAEMDSLLQEQGFYIWWLGQSGYLLQWNGKRVLLDPYLSDSLTRKYAATDKPHTRMSELVIYPSLLKGISIVSSSHNHTDHLDAETLQPVLANNPGISFVIPEANRAFIAERVGCVPGFLSGLNDGEAFSKDGYTFHAVPAKHNEIERDENGCCRYLGYIICFGGYSIYHSGDTLWYDEMIHQLKPFHTDLALLPINGNKPERKVAGNLDTREAALLGKAIKTGCVIPCHYDMFSFNTANPDDFAREATALQQPYRILRGGEYYSCQK
jgi:L-ascorbate metabolism protein UlaG (beta-lactamase superfamily)